MEVFQKDNEHETHTANAAALEKVAFVRDFLDLTYDQYMTVMTDGQWQRPIDETGAPISQERPQGGWASGSL
jgi:hypothetical protein